MYLRGCRVLVLLAASKKVGLPRAIYLPLAIYLLARLKADGVSVILLGTGQTHGKEFGKLTTCSGCFVTTTKKHLVEKADSGR